jgi:hypothetical protein
MIWTMKHFQPSPFWTAPREWETETAFIIAGGPSVLGVDLEQLRGRNVIAINSSIYAAPWAQFLYFGDYRWYAEDENREAVAKFGGRVVTVSRLVRDDPKVFICRKIDPPGLAFEKDSLTQKYTSLTAATNLAVHLIGPGGTIVWLGADGKYAADGRTHHHKQHPWPRRKDAYEMQLIELRTIVPTLEALQITALNASPGTAWTDLLPVVHLDEFLKRRQAA